MRRPQPRGFISLRNFCEEAVAGFLVSVGWRSSFPNERGAGSLSAAELTVVYWAEKSSDLSEYRQRSRLEALAILAHRPHIYTMDRFDYEAPAELFHPVRMGKRSPLNFQRFATSAEAIKYAVEELTPVMLQGAILEVADNRFDSAIIRELYDDGAFPLGRRDG